LLRYAGPRFDYSPGSRHEHPTTRAIGHLDLFRDRAAERLDAGAKTLIFSIGGALSGAVY